MKSDNFLLASLSALALGVAQTILLLYVWNYISMNLPVLLWLASNGLTGFQLRAVSFVFDSVVNISLCLPAAYLLCQLRPRKLMIYLIFAVVPSFLWQYQLALYEPTTFFDSTPFLLGALSSILMLPIATSIVFYLQRRKRA